jgi:hypothetical protein
MLELFTSCVCEHCDRGAEGDFFRGWVVWPKRPDGVIQTWVFRTREDACKWQRNRNDGEVRPVLSPEPFSWTRSRGAIKDIVLAERPFEVFPDHRHPPGAYRAFLAPEDAPDADRVRLHR